MSVTVISADAETVVAAAMIYNGVTCSLPAPARHGDIIHAISTATGKDHWPIAGKQGFITSTGRFVARDEAAIIAVISEQIMSPKYGRELYSEDMW